jgi:hypothetical protein
LAINVTAAVFVNAGQIHADGGSRGQILVQARNILNAGPITADGTTPGGDGGGVYLGFTDSYVGTRAALTSASGGHGGSVVIDGGSTGHLFSSGSHVATGSVGGSIDLRGREVVLSGATVDASGETAGGAVSIGQGRDAAVVATQTVTITPASTIRADALHSGDGGRVSVWADQNTAFSGTASAHGGPAGGSGGFIEVSGQGDLSYAASADATATSGKSGTLLLDPKNIVIADATTGIFPQFDLIDPHSTAGGNFGSSVSVVGEGNVVVANPNDNFGGSSAGAVYLFDGLTGALLSSLVGSHPSDEVGGTRYSSIYSNIAGITSLNNGNYVFQSPSWNDNRGAVTWGNATTGVSGIVSEANSLVGSNPGDRVGYDDYTPVSGIQKPNAITPLPNGNYLVASRFWSSNRGAVTWGNGSTGGSGAVSAANSLVGSKPGDEVGSITNAYSGWSQPGITFLTNGNYVIQSPLWNTNRGAVTWGNGNTGITGAVSEANSLVGSNPGDQIG